MTDISDETLMAYADGELDASGCARVETYIAEDQKGAARLAVFMSTGRSLGMLYDEPMRQPAPQRLIETVLSSPLPAPGSSAIILPFDTARRHRVPLSPKWQLAAACFAFVAVGVGALWISSHGRTADKFGIAVASDGVSIAGPALATVLDAAPSGGALAQVIDGVQASIKPVFSFATVSGSFCRQYEISAPQAALLTGVACRDGRDRWNIETQAASAAVQIHSDPNAGTIVAAGKTSSAAVDAMVDKLIAGDVLGAGDEAEAIHRQWRSAGSE